MKPRGADELLRGPAVRRALQPSLAASLLSTVALLAQAGLLSAVVAGALTGANGGDLAHGALWLLAPTIAVRALLTWLGATLAQRAARTLAQDVRTRLLAALATLGPIGLGSERAGELATTALTGVDRLEAYFAGYAPLRTLSVGSPALIIVTTLAADPLAGIVLLLTAPIIPLLMVVIGRYAGDHVDRHWLALSRLGAQFLDTLQGLTTLVTFGRGAAAADRIAVASADYQQRTLAVLRVVFLSGMTLDIMSGMAIGLVAVVVAIQTISGGAPLWAAIMALILAPECYRPLRDLAARRHEAMEAKVAAERIAALLERASAAAPAVAPQTVPNGPPTIRFCGVTYRYPGAAGPALEDVSLVLRPGTRTALVGASGAGKSTILQLLLRYGEPDAGAILIDDTPLAALSPEAWRRRVAYAPQRPTIFPGTVLENLRRACPDASLAAIQRSVELAGADALIQALPLGYESPLGEQGESLSVGEAQRLAMTRAFLKDAPVLVLDEPTSALDTAHEQRMIAALERLTADRVTLIAAHRRATIRAADQIVVLENGRVVDIGTDGALSRRCPTYRRLIAESDDDDCGAVWSPDRLPAPKLPGANREAGDPRTARSQSPGPLATTAVAALVPIAIGAGDDGAARRSAADAALAVLLAVLGGVAAIGLAATGAGLLGAAARGVPLLALGVPIALVRLFGVGRGIARYAERLTAHRVTFGRMTALRRWCFACLLPLAPAHLLAFRSGDLLARLVADVQTMEERFQRVTLPTAIAVVLGVAAATTLAVISVWLATTLLTLLALAGIVLPWLASRMRGLAEEQFVAEQAAVQGRLVTAIQGLADLLTLCGDAASWVDTHALDALRRRLARVQGIQLFAAATLIGFGQWAMLALALTLHRDGLLAVIPVVVVALATPIALEAVLPMAEARAFAGRSAAAARRVCEVAAARPAVTELPGPWPAIGGTDLRFDRVTFAYRPGQPALRDVSFVAPVGARIAIVGPSGAGKSTLLHLALRFWDPTEGAISVGGLDIRRYALADLRRQIGLVSQRGYIFADTLRRNLLLARPEATDQTLLAALRRAGLEGLAQGGAHGLDRWLGEHGVQLSGGERQRVAVARAVLQDAPILLLDEPTANLDPAMASAVLLEMDRLANGRSTIWVTHDLDPDRMATMDEILVMAGGAVVERGRHNLLLRQDGLYRRLMATPRRPAPDGAAIE